MRRPSVSKHLVWLVTAALIAQSWLAPLATAAVAADTNTIVICTASGFKVISLPDDVGPPADPAENSHEHGERHLDCAACLVHAVAKINGGGAFGITSITWPAFIIDVAFETSLKSSASLNTHPARAPPAG